MRSMSGQQMLDWASVTPRRPVAIDISETDRPGAGRLAEHLDDRGIPDERRVPSTGDPAFGGPLRGGAAPRSVFRLDRLSREQLMDEIIGINGAATAGFLAEFADGDLRLYLGRLRSTQLGRGRSSVSERPAGVPAISAHKRRG